MMKRLSIALAAVAMTAAVACAQVVYPAPDGKNSVPSSTAFCLNSLGQSLPCQHPYAFTSINATSGNVAAATATATLAAAANKTTYLCGLAATGGGATAAAAVNLTATNVIGGTMTFTFAVPVGVDVPAQGLSPSFYPCLPANAVNTAIVVSMPSLGSGNAHAAVNAWGFQQ